MPKTVLVVDDEPYAALLVEITLSRWGYKVVSASDSDEALAAAREHTFDLILIDVWMPQSPMNGLDLCRHFAHNPQTAQVPIVMLTAFGKDLRLAALSDSLGATATESGAVDFITKPYSPKLLARKVEDLIGPASDDSSGTSDCRKEP